MTDSQLGNNNRNISSNNSNNNRNNIANVNSTGSNNSSSINNVIINSNTSIINNNNYNSSNNNRKNHYEEPRYLHKKFKKIATTEVIDTVVNESVSQALQTKDSFFNLVSTNIIELNESCKSGYICPYCKLSCAKPSVLQKHIRAHTNERPYPCIRCGFAFKTKSNFYKHCKSRAHAIKMEGDDVIKVLQTTLQHSEDSDLSHSDSASNDASSPPPLLSSLQPPLVSTSSLKSLTVDSNAIISHKTAKIYKPKFHTALQQCTDTETTSKTNIDFLKDHIECVINDSRNIVPSVNPHLFKLLHAQKDPHRPDIFRKRSYELNTKKSYYPTIDAEVEFNNKCKLKSEFNSKSELDCYNTNQQSLDSPGPVLGHTSLISVQKRPKLDELSSYSRPSALQMFGGEVRILDHSGESKTLRIEPCSSRASKAISFTSMSSVSGSETASVLVRSSLHSGGTILQKPAIENVLRSWNSDHSFTRLTPNISPPCLAPSLGVLHISETHSFSIHLSESDKETIKATVNASTVENKFIRPSSLSLKPISFATNCHLGITSTANTVTLISPETPRSKKSYGQLYLNGHAYTYLGLKCSTRLFYCTLNRPQPMYVTQQNGLSMYSNWKICKEAPSELELAQYDSRHRPTGYTLACSHYGDILTHSSQRPYELKSFDSSLESDSQEKVQKFQLVNNESENIENYTCIHTKNKTKRHENEQQFNDILMNVYKEEAISCKKTSKFKKHIPVHMNNKPFRCALCAFNFKTKNNMNKHMKSKAHSKKCIESRVLFDGNSTEMDCLISTDDSSTSEDDSEIDAEAASDESGGEEREAARGLLSLGRPITFQLPGLLPSSRPVTYPYSHTAKSQELDELAVPIDLSIRQSNEPVIELASLASVTSLVADFPGRGAGTNTVQIPLGLDIIPRKVVVGGPAFHINTPSTIGIPNFTSITEDARSICGICNKVFSKPSQLRLHINIHYFERPFKCESCGTSFRTKGHLTKHERSTIHHNKVSMTSTFGAATASNPRPFKCTDCKSAFRIHGHLAKHLRSKMHIMKLECLRKLPFGTYAEIERSGVNLNDIDTNDCDTSLTSLRIIAQKLFEKDPSKLEQWEIRMLPIGDGDSTSDEGENNPVQSITQCTNAHLSQNYYMTMCSQSNEINITERRLNETIRIKLK